VIREYAFIVLGRRTNASGNTLAIVAESTRYGLLLLFLLPGTGLGLVNLRFSPSTMNDVLLRYLGVG
jgi:hypothetical protein